ncbi:MAG TPA: phosphatase PAP2 family protein, partial [Rhizomicrobium sp.]
MSRFLLALGAVAALALSPAVLDAADDGYLTGTLDLTGVLQPAPVKGDVRYEADRKIFLATRALVGTPRWDLAVSDVKASPADMLRDFSCAAGVALTPDNAPRLVAFVSRAGRDTSRATKNAKDHFKRDRPFLVDAVDDAKVCEPVKELSDSFDYPSGHTTWGWTWATILAELVPERAAAILARGRAYGESRVVCGAHNASAVEAGRLSASATLSAVRASLVYQDDFKAARDELD